VGHSERENGQLKISDSLSHTVFGHIEFTRRVLYGNFRYRGRAQETLYCGVGYQITRLRRKLFAQISLHQDLGVNENAQAQ
jgi:hypothetical protein